MCVCVYKLLLIYKKTAVAEVIYNISNGSLIHYTTMSLNKEQYPIIRIIEWDYI